VKEKKFKSVNIWQSYKQERDCLVHFLRLLALCWPSAQSTGVCCRQANQQQAVRVLSCIVSSECEHQSRPHFWAKRLMLVTYRYVTIGNCVLKTAEWLNGLGNCTDVFYVFNVFFQNPKNTTFYVFWSCCARFSNTDTRYGHTGWQLFCWLPVTVLARYGTIYIVRSKTDCQPV